MPAATVPNETETEAPVRGISGPPKPIRVKPGFQERLREAKVEVIGAHRVDTDEQTIFDQFCEEAFEPWLRSKLEPPPASRKKTEKAKPGDEGSR